MKPGRDVSGLMLSILAHDAASGTLGIALASSSVAVGSRCPYLLPGKAVVASQGYTNFKVGPLALDLVGCGLTVGEVMAALRQHDRWMSYRQIAIVSAAGEVEAHTGDGTQPWSGHRAGPGLVCLGNGLPGAAPLQALHDGFGDGTGLPLAERLLHALEKARASVGSRRAVVSSSLLVRARDGTAPIDLRVDLARDLPEAGGCAVADLRRLHDTFHPLAGLYDQRSEAPRPTSAHASGVVP